VEREKEASSTAGSRAGEENPEGRRMLSEQVLYLVRWRTGETDSVQADFSRGVDGKLPGAQRGTGAEIKTRMRS